jgi:outer membrane receptor for ferric coprogen and ferric-rhodotorulic acid
MPLHINPLPTSQPSRHKHVNSDASTRTAAQVLVLFSKMQFSYKLTPRIDLKATVHVRFSAVSNIDDDNDAYQATNTSVSIFLQLTATSLPCQLNVEVFATRFKIH